MEKNLKNEIDDDLPPELEELPTELINKKGTQSYKSGTTDYGDYTQVKEEVSISKPKEAKEEFGGNKS